MEEKGAHGLLLLLGKEGRRVVERVWGSKEAEHGGHEGVCRPGQRREFTGPLCPSSGELEQRGLFQGWYCAGGGSLSVLSAMRLKERRRLQGLTGGGTGGGGHGGIHSILTESFP